MLKNGQIPTVNGKDPSMMTAQELSDPTNLLAGNYSAVPDVSTTGILGSNTSCYYVPQTSPAMILAYPITWFNSWQDIDAFAPSATFGGTSTFLNTGSQTYTYTNNGAQVTIPQLEDQISLLLQNWCGIPSTTCPAGINDGKICSNIFATRTNGPNYCNEVYNNLTGTTYSPAVVSAISTSISNYCNPSNFQNNQLPTECFCAVPTASPYFAALEQQAQGANINVQNPYVSDAGFNGSFGNVGCWWFFCQNPQSYLVPLPVSSSGSCPPEVCENIVNIINNGTINLSGTTISQTINCPGISPPKTCSPACSSSQTCVDGQCVSGACGTGGACPSGQKCQGGVCITPCSANSDCPSDETCSSGICIPKSSNPSILTKYWWLFLIGLIFLLFFLGLISWLFFKK
jgi:hypothetical protein